MKTTFTDNYKTMNDAFDAIHAIEQLAGVEILSTHVKYEPDSIASMFKYDYKPYRLTVEYVEH